MINNRHLEVFIAVYEEGSMTAAARKIHMTQPAVSQTIKEIENEYETEMFERYGSKLYVTQAGKLLYNYALRIKNIYKDLDEAIRINEGVREIRVGGNISVGTAQIIPMIESFHEIHPDIQVRTRVCQGPLLLNDILKNELDIALTEIKQNDPAYKDFVIEPYYHDRIIVVCSPEHKFAGKKVKLADISKENFLFREKGAGVRDMFDQILSLKKMSVKVTWECTSTEAIVRAVSKNMGIAVLPYLLVTGYLKEGIIKEITLSDVSLSRDLNIIYHKDKVLTKPLLDFIEVAKKMQPLL